MNKKNLAYKLSGEIEPAIVCLHGWGMDSTCFDMLVQNIHKSQKVFRLDFFGFGKSDLPEEFFDTYEYAYSVFLLLSQLHIKKVILIGHSFGGRVAIILSSIFGVEVCHLILTSSAGLNRFNLIKSIKVFKYKLLKKMVKLKVLKSGILNKYGSSDYKKLNDRLQKNFVKIVNQDLCFLLKNIVCNTYLVWNKKDKDTPFWICKKLNKNIKQSKIVLYKNGGHFCFLSNIYKFSILINNVVNNRDIGNK